MFFDQALPPDAFVQTVALNTTTISAEQGFTKTIKLRCQDVAHIIPGEEALNDLPNLRDPSRDITPLPFLLEKLGYTYRVGIGYKNLDAETKKAMKIDLLEFPKHGTLTRDKDGYSYDYKPKSGYIGRDRMVFWAEVAGKRYKLIKEVAVVNSINDNYPDVCITGKFVSDAQEATPYAPNWSDYLAGYVAQSYVAQTGVALNNSSKLNNLTQAIDLANLTLNLRVKGAKLIYRSSLF